MRQTTLESAALRGSARTNGRKQAARSGELILNTPGGSSLMVIFAVLCLTVFAILALSTVLADARLSETCAEGVSAYYAADGEAEKIIAALRAGEEVSGVEKNGNVYSFSCPVSDSQTLVTVVRVEDGAWELLSRTTVYTADWNSDSTLSVWQGE